MEEASCILCSGPGEPWFEKPDKFPPHQRFRVLRCRACGLGWVSPRPTPAEIGGYYPDTYSWRPEPEGAEPAVHRLERWYRFHLLRFETRQLAARTDLAPGDAVLDVGCGSGDRLLVLKEAGLVPAGVEITPAADYARERLGLDVRRGALPDARFEDARFRAVTLYNVIEHVHDPRALLGEARRVLAPGGWLVLQCPNARSLQARAFGRRWAALDVPRDLYYYTPAILGRLLREEGFEPAGAAHRTSFLHPPTAAISLAPWTDPQRFWMAEAEGSAAGGLARRARVTRSGTATLGAGVHRLEMVELPLSLDPASVRASARGTARARLLGVDVRRQFYAQVPTERVRELEGQVEALQDEMGGLDAQVELLKREQAALGELAGQTEIYARGLAFGKTTAEAHMTLLDRLRARTEGLNAALVDAGARRREMERRLQKLQGELDLLRGARGYERYTAIIEIEVVQAGELAVALTYGVSDAGWQPLYDVRLVEEGERRLLEVGYLAQVTQRAGEDWAAVALTLSTARPALAETLPELDPWYVGPVEALRPPPAPVAMGAGGDLMRMRAAAAPQMEAAFSGAGLMAEAAAPAVLEAAVAMAAVAGLPGSLGAALTYQVPGTATIPADGAPHKVTVARFELAPELDYVTAPKLVETAYRRAKVINDSPYTLLPGAANLFAGDEFIGATELELVAAQGEIELYLGADDRVKVERELKRREVDKRFIGDRRRLSYGYQITLESLLPAEVRVTLHDQIPASRHEDVKVKLEFADPKPTQQTELNLLDWELTLAPGESRVVRFDFTVEYPRTMSLMGLP